MLATSRVSNTGAFVFLAGNTIANSDIICFSYSDYAPFCVLQCRVHEIWAQFMASSLEDRLRYTPSDCFETFPFPMKYESNEAFASTGQTYYEFRAELMRRNNEGLTETYNRFSRPDDRSADIIRLRELHDALDRVVLDAYDWHDLHPTPHFVLEFDTEDEEETEIEGMNGRSSQRPPKLRYRWPEEIRDDILARLLALNTERASLQAPPAAKPNARKSSLEKRGKVDMTSEREPALFE